MEEFEDLGERIRFAAIKVGGNDSLALKTGIKLRTLGNYIAGKTDIKSSDILKISQISGLSLNWLVAGIGEPESGFHSRIQSGYSEHPKDIMGLKPISPEIVEEVTTKLYDYMERNKLVLDGASFGKAAAILAKWAAESGGLNQDVIERLMAFKSQV